ncbi:MULTISPECIES: TetR/AcrR family transcriptional regulator [Rhizobium/Agrobacterium group]|jgi:TetR/AcrR family transcriptional repressor of nem operon|uniref:TetR/AcrR family transcriptional regulator n=1 Tax=Rhizobium/Agrobacterium group TaxID=227290 RepID=UPI000CF8745C|nr:MULTISPECIES: TetR/AcrR family transcriptional regulator [Rhizobium/Agrobacterium group]MBY3038365.1 TetR/AcrR family transcriptional regulator [Rhizobium laguerreae]MBY3257152.1 TetR/AcrR family transcriptional regulator [Rhizobium laguerreae]MBY3284499.1 TetR/AcrR family transcriptional regulator [Rhizobium laguerreae]MBY3290470.1 TetR/AcrR family transcriptional regulator [Rhizobium laguerreae]MBY3422534.1 TetR/AcrR family transcriptional regulator [Rhizobium laguerreae]
MSNLSTTSDDILASARSLLMSGGYNSFSYADISEMVGIRKASIHHHFPSKADLVRELVKRYREDGEASIVTLEQNVPDALDTLKVYANHWSKCIEDASRPYCICALLASELPSLPPEVATEVTKFFRFISSWLTKVMERGSKSGALNLTSEPHVEAEAFLATVYGAMLSARAYGKPEVFSTILAPALARLTPTVPH